jgi:hypothetical protein
VVNHLKPRQVRVAAELPHRRHPAPEAQPALRPPCAPHGAPDWEGAVVVPGGDTAACR